MLSIRDLCNSPTSPVSSDSTVNSHTRSQSAPVVPQSFVFHHKLNSNSDSDAGDTPKRKPRARFTLEEKWNIVQELKTHKMVQSQLAKKYNTSQENISRWNSALEKFSSLAEAKLHKTRGSPQLRLNISRELEESALTLAALSTKINKLS